MTSSDLAGETERWFAFTDAAMAAGFRAAAAVPMRLRREPVGVLTLLNREPIEVGPDTITLGQALADVATVGILHHRTAGRSEILTEQLQATLHHRVVVEQAKGVLAETGNLSPQTAFELLRDYARTNGQRLSDLARSLADGTIHPASLLVQRGHIGPHTPA